MKTNWTDQFTPNANDELKAYFGFLAEPFTKEIAAKSIYLSAQLKTLFTRLGQFISRRGLALITGEVGSGKSTAMRAFEDSLEKNRFDWVYIEDPTIGLSGIWHQIAAQLNLDTKYFKWQIMTTIKNAIEKNFHDYRKTTIIVIDDAQLLKPTDLEELRLFTSFKIDSHSPMLLILLAQPQFRKLIALKALEAFNQRLTFRAHLSGLQYDEAQEYVKHQLQVAGRTDPLFTDDVIHEIYQHAKGLPRLINTLCYECLLQTYTQKNSLVDLPTLEKVLCAYDEV